MISAVCKTYVDYLIYITETKSLAKEATHQVNLTMGYIVLRDDKRKRRPIYQTNGEWTGFDTLSLEGVGLFVTVS